MAQHPHLGHHVSSLGDPRPAKQEGLGPVPWAHEQSLPVLCRMKALQPKPVLTSYFGGATVTGGLRSTTKWTLQPNISPLQSSMRLPSPTHPNFYMPTTPTFLSLAQTAPELCLDSHIQLPPRHRHLDAFPTSQIKRARPREQCFPPCLSPTPHPPPPDHPPPCQ